MFLDPQSQQAVVIVTQAQNIKGWNNATAIIGLANAVREKFEILPEMLILIEYFPKAGERNEAFDLVSFHWEGNSFKNPKRRRILRSDAEELTGDAIKPV